MFADALPQFSALDADSRLQLIEKLVFDLHWLMIGQWSHLQPLQSDFEQLFTTDPSPSVLGCQPTSTGHSKECRVRMSSSGKRRQREKSIKLKMWNQLQAVNPPQVSNFQPKVQCFTSAGNEATLTSCLDRCDGVVDKLLDYCISECALSNCIGSKAIDPKRRKADRSEVAHDTSCILQRPLDVVPRGVYTGPSGLSSRGAQEPTTKESRETAANEEEALEKEEEEEQEADDVIEVDAAQIHQMVRRARKLACTEEEISDARDFNSIGLERQRALLGKLWPSLALPQCDV